MRLFFAFILLLMATGGGTFAQSYNGTAQGNFIVYSIQSLTITGMSGPISFDSPNDYFNGVIAERYANLSVKSSVNWQLSFAAQSTYFTPLSNGGSTDMPSTVVGIRQSGQATFKTLTTQSQWLTNGSRGSETAKHNFNIDVSFNPGFKYNGGLYSIGVMYTLTRQ